VPPDPGAISSQHPDGKSQIVIERLTIRPGSSGAPVVSPKGIVGMVQQGNEDEAYALTIDFIKDSMQDWNHPWDLVPSEGAPAPARLQPEPAPAPVKPQPEQSCRVSIRSTPSGAAVSVDDVARGKTPATVELTRGRSYDLEVAAEGYTTSLETISCSTPTVNVDLEPRAASILVRYLGDSNFCTLQLSFKIGNKTFVPTSNAFPVDGIPMGKQRYTVQGQIGCLVTFTGAPGRCNASGSGQIEVKDGAAYNTVWAGDAFGNCTVVLAPAQ
jgi:hypothetical protein